MDIKKGDLIKFRLSDGVDDFEELFEVLEAATTDGKELFVAPLFAADDERFGVYQVLLVKLIDNVLFAFTTESEICFIGGYSGVLFDDVLSVTRDGKKLNPTEV